MRFKVEFGQRGRRAPKRVVAPPSPVVSRAARQLALAYWIERQIDAGRLVDLADAARVLSVTRARVTQIANLRLLPVDVQERVLEPGYVGTERALRCIELDRPERSVDGPRSPAAGAV